MPDITIQELELTDYITSNDYMFLDRGNRTYKIKPSNLGGFNADNIIYVATNGDDNTNSGLSPAAPFKTLKKACYYANNNSSKKYTILLSSGTYFEENPIVIPKNTSVIGDNFKNVTIKPNNRQYDVLWVNDLSYIYGVKITNQLKPAFAITFPDTNNTTSQYQIAYNTPDYEITSPNKAIDLTFGPYIDECEINTKGYTLPLQSQVSQVNHSYSYTNQSLDWVNSLYNNISSIVLQKEEDYSLISPRNSVPLVAYDDVYSYLKSIKNNYDNKFDFYNINATLTSFGVDVINSSLSSNFYRDVSFILNAVAYDVYANSNRLASEVGRHYFYNLSSLILPYSGYNTKNAVLSGLNHIYTKIKSEVFPGVPTPYTLGTVASFITKEFEYLSQTVSNLQTIYTPVTSAPASFISTAYALSANKNFITEETFAYLNYNYFGSLDVTISTDFKNDLNLIIDNTISDLLSGTNTRTMQSGFIFYDKIKSILPDQTIIYSDIFRQMFDLSTSIIKNQSISALSVECGNGIKIDGSLVSGYNKNMTIDTTEHIIQGGTGIYITNNASAKLYNIRTTCCNESVLCDNGGTCIIDGSHSTYGLSGLVSKGYSPTPVLSAITTGTFTTSDSSLDITSIIPLNVASTVPFVLAPYVGLRAEFRLNNNTLSSIYLPINITPFKNNGFGYKLYFSENFSKNIPTNTPVYFYIRSSIKANSHTFENIGTGPSIQNGNIATGYNSINYKNEKIIDSTASNPSGIIICSSFNDIGEFNVNDILKVSSTTNNINISGTQIIESNSSDAALRITQTGSGNALVVEDSSNPDSTPFIVKNDGGVGIGTQYPNEKLTVVGNISSNNNIYANTLFLSGSEFIKNDLTVYGGISAVKDITATNLNLSGSGLIANNLTVYGGISAVKDITATNLNLSGSGLFSNNLTVYGGISAVKDITATNLNLSGSGFVKNNLTVYGGISAVKDITATNLNLSGSGLFSNNLTVYGGISAVKDITATNLNLSGSGLIANNLTVYGGISAIKDITATNLNLSGSGFVKNNLTVYGGISAVKDITATNLNLSGSGLIANNLTVYGGISAVKDITATNLNLSGSGFVKNNLTIYGGISAVKDITATNLNLSGSGLISNNLTVYGGISAVKDITATNLNLSGSGLISNNLTVYGGISAVKDITATNLNLSGSGFVKNNLTVYGGISAVKDITATNLFLSGDIYIKNSLTVDKAQINDLTITGNLSVLGNATQIDTIISTTSALEIQSFGVGPALKITQYGFQPIAHFIDSNGDDIMFADNGYVGLGVDSPNEKLTVVGNISSTGIVYALGGNSNNWNSVFSSTRATSANWNSVFNSVVPVSANWNSVFTSTRNNSANWDSVYSSVVPVSANWNSIFSSVVPVSANWNSVYSSTKDTSGNWNSVYNSVVPVSANWNSVFNSVVPVSANWNSVFSSVVPVSANWNSVYSSTKDASGNWDSVFSSVVPVSANWNSVYSSTKDASGNWDSVYSSTKDTSGNWDSVYSSVLATSANWDSVYSSTKDTSGNWDSVYSSSIATSGNWDSVYSSSVATSGNWDSVYSSSVATSGNWDSVYSSSVATSGNWDSVYSSVVPVSGNWNSVYSSVLANSATYATITFTDTKYFPISGGVITGNTRFNKDITVYGNISATGNSYFANTVYSTTSALSVININNNGPALYVSNNGIGDLASFYDVDSNVEQLHIGGYNGSYPNVGVKTSTPNKDLTVKGEISASGDIWTSGRLLSGGFELLSLITPKTNETYNTVQSNSATTWNYQGTDIKALSSNWQTAYVYVQSNSATTWNYQGSDIKALTANWDNTYTNFRNQSADNLSVFSTVANNSASNWNWNYQGNDLKALSANWDNTYTNFRLQSSDNLSVFSTVLANSATTWNYQGSDIKALTANWDTAFDYSTTYNQNSSTYATINFVDNKFLPLSGGVITGDLTIQGNISTLGSTTQIDTMLFVTSAVNVTNHGSGPALKVTQIGVEDIVNIYDDSNIALTIKDGGNVGINVNNPNEKLTVNGNISSNAIIYDIAGNSNEWNDIYTSVSSISSVWNDTSTSTQNTSGDWDSVYNSVVATSGNWDSVYSSVVATSANWDSVYSSVLGISGDWDSVYSSVVATSGDWNSVYSTYQTNSSDYTDYTFLQNNYLPLSGGTVSGELDVIINNAVSTTLFVSGNRVGINTETPVESLTVYGNISASGMYKFAGPSTAPSDTINPITWIDVQVGGTVYKMPLYL